MSVGKHIKEIREDHNLSQESFAGKLNMQRANVGKIETDRVKPTMDTLIILYKEFKVNINWILLGAGKKYIHQQQNTDYVNETRAEYAVTNIWKELAEERKERIEELKAEVERLKTEKVEFKCAPTTKV